METADKANDWSAMHPREKEEIVTQMIMGQGGTATDIEVLLDEGMSPDQELEMGAPILQIAAHRGMLDLVKLLLDRGADINLVFDDGGTGRRLLTALDAATSPDAKRSPDREQIIELLRAHNAKTGDEMREEYTKAKAAEYEAYKNKEKH